MTNFWSNRRKKKEERITAQYIWEHSLSHRPTTANFNSTALSKGFTISHTSTLMVFSEWIWGWFFSKSFLENATFGWYSSFPGMLRIYTKDAVELYRHRSECIILKPLCCYFLTILGFLHSHSDHLFIIRQILKNFLWKLIHCNKGMFSLSKDESTLGKSCRISLRL